MKAKTTKRAPRSRAGLIRNRVKAVTESEKKVVQKAAQLAATANTAHELNREHERLLAVLEEEKIAAARSNAQATALAKDLEASRDAAKIYEAIVVKLRGDIDNAQITLNDSGRECERLAAMLETEKAAAARSSAQAALLIQELEISRATAKEHEATAVKLRAEFNDAQLLAHSRQNELDKLSDELASTQSVVKDRDGAIERFIRDLEATRSYLRESQTEVQRLAGERDGARAEAEQAKVEFQRVSAAFAAANGELDRALAGKVKLQQERDGLHLVALQLPALRAQLAALKEALAGARDEADRKDRRIAELSAALEATGAERERALQRVAQMSEAAATQHERIAALEALRATALAEAEKKSQNHVRALRDQLIDAEAALGKAKRGRNGASWTTPFSESRRAARALSKSGLIDATWYLREYPDVAASGRSPAEHYVEEGYARGYQPNPFFDTRWYLERNEDVRQSGKNPLLHYLQYGFREGRDPGPNFQTNFYLEANPDVRTSGKNPLAHYLRYGRHEGRLPAPRA